CMQPSRSRLKGVPPACRPPRAGGWAPAAQPASPLVWDQTPSTPSTQRIFGFQTPANSACLACSAFDVAFSGVWNRLEDGFAALDHDLELDVLGLVLLHQLRHLRADAARHRVEADA